MDGGRGRRMSGKGRSVVGWWKGSGKERNGWRRKKRKRLGGGAGRART